MVEQIRMASYAAKTAGKVHVGRGVLAARRQTGRAARSTIPHIAGGGGGGAAILP